MSQKQDMLQIKIVSQIQDMSQMSHCVKGLSKKAKSCNLPVSIAAKNNFKNSEDPVTLNLNPMEEDLYDQHDLP